MRAYLAGNPPEETQRKHEALLLENDSAGYDRLASAAFVTAVRRRFAPTYTLPEIIGFVANVRVDWRNDDMDMNARAAEFLVRRALGERVSDDTDEQTRTQAQVILLAELVAAERFDDAGLDEFLTQARRHAEQLMSLPTPPWAALVTATTHL